ncbi:MAG: DUF1353 domain-containing protein [Candidatus Thermoplasmatota archaeon]|jgi:hypothetical protein|nr:DUF1353 domain-containing protein [Candidatus Thermoplasmatota archaeon]
MGKACYRKLGKYKYQLMGDYVIKIDIKPSQNIDFEFISLSTDGALTIRKGYAWDGASGPAIDTREIMRGSLVHDVLYQLMRLSALNHKVHRKPADQIMKDICLEDKMCSFRAWYVYQGVHLFAEHSARPRKEPEVEIICVP